ncbi:T9SS type A sorting domain-containing protein [Psychroserpens sp. MEBiC05023]
MKTKLLFLSLLLTTSLALSQVVGGQVDDFQSDTTTQNWIIGSPGSAVSPPAHVSGGGPAGGEDNYLTYTAIFPENMPYAGSKMVIFNAGAQWSGDFTSEGIVAIEFDARVTTSDLNLRVAFQGPNGRRICTTNAVNVIAGSGWQSISIPISAADFTAVGGSGSVTIEQVLAAVNTMRILSSSVPTWVDVDDFPGSSSTLDLDNITASLTLGVGTIEAKSEFEISPNPATSKLNINLSQNLDNANITVYNVLGKKVYTRSLDTLTSSIDVSNWNSGIYLVRISTNSKTITKRFVKQ